MKLTKHIGRMTNTDQRVVVVYMQLPDAKNYALVAPTDSLPPHMEQAVMDILGSAEGQNAKDLASVLGRRLMPDTKHSVLEALHLRGYLTRIPVDNITMYPAPNMPFPLKAILEKIGGQTIHTETASELPTERFNPHTNNISATKTENNIGIGSNLLAEAAMLEAEAIRKREQAYQYAPHLRPTAKAEPSILVPQAVLDEYIPVEEVQFDLPLDGYSDGLSDD